MGSHQRGSQQVGDGEGPECALHDHKGESQTADGGQPGGQSMPFQQACAAQHHQGHAHHEGIQAMEPFQKDLDVELASRKPLAVTERPVRAGQTGLHHPGCAADHHKGEGCDHEMGGERGQADAQGRGWQGPHQLTSKRSSQRSHPLRECVAGPLGAIFISRQSPQQQRITTNAGSTVHGFATSPIRFR